MAAPDKKEWFSASVNDCADPAFGFAFRLTRNRADAEDLVAEAVTKAWAALDTLQDQKQFRSWLFRIVHNTFVSGYRKKAVRPIETSYNETAFGDNEDDITTFLIEQPDDFLSWWGTPERDFANKVLGEDIVAAIDVLPEAYRAVVQLVTVDGLSYGEAADILAVPKGTVHSRMKRGRTLLQKALWEHAHDAGLLAPISKQG